MSCIPNNRMKSYDFDKISMNPIVYAGSNDIEKAFLHFKHYETDRDMTRFCFRLTDYTNPDAKFQPASILNTYIFWSNLLAKNPWELTKSLYTDKILTSFEDDNWPLKFYNTYWVHLAKTGFNLRIRSRRSKQIRKMY